MLEHSATRITPFRRTPIAHSIRSVLIGSAAAIALSSGGAVLAAETGDIDTLDGAVHALGEQVDHLSGSESQPDHDGAKPDAGRSEVVRARTQVEPSPRHLVNSPTTLRPAGSHTDITVGGYVKGDFIVDLDDDVGDSFAVSQIALNDDQDIDSHVRMHGRESRLYVSSDTELDGGNVLRTYIEGDFFGGGGNELFSNSDGFRLRHAYGEYSTPAGSLLVGQTWTLFGGFNYMPTVDFFAANGQTFLRQGQVRWTFSNGFAVSLENPETFYGFGEANTTSADEVPDLVLKWTGGPGGAGGNYSISGVLRQVGGTGTGVDGEAFDDTTNATGIHLGGSWDFGTIALTGGVAFGDGLGRYHLANTSAGVIGVDGKVETIDQIGVTGGISFATTATSSINVSVGYSERDDDFEDYTPTADESGYSVHANYMFSPWPDTNFGFEVVHGGREQFDGEEGDATRLQFGAQRSF